MQIKAIGRNHLSIQTGHCQKLDKHYLMEVWRKGNIPPLMLGIYTGRDTMIDHARLIKTKKMRMRLEHSLTPYMKLTPNH